jgi:hypothetical protein
LSAALWRSCYKIFDLNALVLVRRFLAEISELGLNILNYSREHKIQ